ncbi:MAG: DNA polymerase III subunit gamma/tau [Hydrogenophilales bacterium 28-61-23]|nr:MAG: DNA polymerase III subunit gamma/tau [Hydrogenophilales bacterium 28-61-23]
MSHQVLARKWRPRNFSQLVGQEHVVRALSNALAQGRLHHAYLFTGTRGVGKTTLARILAKCLNCTHDDHPSAEPCGVCPACTEIDGGRFIDLIEIDAASNTGIDNMRDVIENAQYAPTAGRYKVYIIDEVHMLSKNAFNAMLKTLEEPPGHVIFILATTDPQKVPVTVLSRCLQFNLKQMPPGHIAGHLKNVLEAENVPFESGALSLLARAAAGSMRDALSLTDQAIAYCTGEVKEDETRAMLGVIDQAYLLPVLEALAALDGPRLMAEAAELAARGFSFDAALQDLAGLLHQIALAQSVPEAVAEDAPERDRLFELARQLDPESVQLHYQIATLGRRDLEWAPDEYAGFSMTLLRMLAFAPGDAPAARAPAPVSAAEKAPASIRPATAALSAGVASANAAIASRAQINLAAAANEPLAPVQAEQPVRAKPAQTAIEPVAAGNDWRPLAESLPGLVRQLAMQCEQIERNGTLLRLALPESQKALLASVGDKMRAALAEKLGSAIKVEIDLVADTGGLSPAAERAREQAVRQSEAEQAIHNDPFVQTLVRECDATLTNIRPRIAAAG